MEKSIFMHSKTYVRPKKITSLWAIFLNICLIIYVLTNLFIIIVEGININLIGRMCFAIIVVRGVSAISKPHYELSSAEITFKLTQMQITYNNVEVNKKGNYDQFIILNKDNIEKIEYSDKLMAFRFTGSFKKAVSDNLAKYHDINEWILYVEKEKIKEVADTIQVFTGEEIVYVDMQT